MREICQSGFDEREEETELRQTGLRRRGESPATCHRKATVTAPLLDSTRISDNVGGVKQLLSIPIRALGEERHFALVEMAVPTTGSLVIVFQVQTLGPTHASLRSRTAIMITTSNSSLKRSGTPNQLLGVLLHTIAISGLSRVSVWACGPLNLMKMAPSRMQNRTGSERRD
jgi:hypothetical protein